MRRWLLPWAMGRRFDAAAAAGLDATIELAVDGAVYALAIRDGRCTVRRGPACEPGARATIALRDLVALVRGTAAWPELLSRRRIAFSGDPFLALRLPALFRLTAPGATARPRGILPRLIAARPRRPAA